MAHKFVASIRQCGFPPLEVARQRRPLTVSNSERNPCHTPRYPFLRASPSRFLPRQSSPHPPLPPSLFISALYPRSFRPPYASFSPADDFHPINVWF